MIQEAYAADPVEHVDINTTKLNFIRGEICVITNRIDTCKYRLNIKYYKLL